MVTDCQAWAAPRALTTTGMFWIVALAVFTGTDGALFGLGAGWVATQSQAISPTSTTTNATIPHLNRRGAAIQIPFHGLSWTRPAFNVAAQKGPVGRAVN